MSQLRAYPVQHFRTHRRHAIECCASAFQVLLSPEIHQGPTNKRTDCCAYACAQVNGLELVYKGQDLSHTDLAG